MRHKLKENWERLEAMFPQCQERRNHDVESHLFDQKLILVVVEGLI